MSQQNTLPGYHGNYESQGSIPGERKEFLEFLRKNAVGTLGIIDLQKMHPDWINVRKSEAMTLQRKADDEKTRALSLLQQACLVFSSYIDTQNESKLVNDLYKRQYGSRKEKRLVLKTSRAYHTVKQALDRRKKRRKFEEKLQKCLEKTYDPKNVEAMIEEYEDDDDDDEEDSKVKSLTDGVGRMST